jgi:methylmalonyl-CoA mutase N-terminal domain/subunit
LIQRDILESAYRTQQAIDSGAAIVVGVNRFVSGDAPKIDIFRIDPAIEREQAERVRDVRASRDAGTHRSALASLSAAARDGSNLMPPIIAAVEARATVGEISDVLRTVFGEHRDPGGT